MKITRENIRLTGLLISAWITAIIRISFSQPNTYLEDILTSHPGKERVLSDPEWRIVKKTVKGTKKISVLFRKDRKCLVESMIVQHSLKKFGIPNVFKLGARAEEKKISTHAWIEIEDKTVIGGPVKGYNDFIRTR